MKYLSFLAITLFVLTGCSTKQYFDPDDTTNFKTEYKTLDAKIIDYNNNGATLENNKFISKDGISKNKLPKTFFFLNKSENSILASNNHAELLIRENDTDTFLKFKSNIISAAKKGNTLAFVSVDNSIVIYDIETKQIKHKQYLKASAINDIKIASAVFLDSIVLFPTLDGKIVIIDLNTNKQLQSINVDPSSDINNIIFLEAIGDNLVAATLNKIFTFNNGKINIQDHDIKNVAVKNENIYISTLDGQIIKYDMNLVKKASKKFRFAKFYAIAATDKLYALESQEFLVTMDMSLENKKVYDFDFSDDEKVITLGNKIYFEDKYIELK